MSQRAGVDELAAFRQSVRQLCREFGHDYYLRTSEQAGNARELWHALGAMGALGVAIPEEHGGGGQGIEALAIVAEEVATAGSPLMLIALSPAVCATMLAHHGSPEQRAEWLPGLADGSRVLGFAITEPDAGSNTHNISTRAVFDDGDWVISGQKYYVSHVDNADALVVIANAEGGPESLPPGPKAFLVPTDAPGLKRTEIKVEIISPERQYSLFFDDVRVPADAVVGGADGIRVLFTGLNPERILSAALLNGISRYAIDKAAAYARTRRVWGVPIGAHQAVAHPLAKAETALAGARLLTQAAAEAYDRGETGGVAAAMAKLAASDAVSLALDAAVQTHGGNGMSREYGLATLSGLVRLFRIAPVSSEMLLNHIAHKALDLPRSYG
ncbi:acyl-CoA dehydrogenase family protein [Dactylosporangium sucinum]|uniref:Acyl-CoA dehydrogenase FadE n=1 Tax=Dactylosporangium sucinum TaxID=1424081 RepID=A0A917U1H8_9ACTN|nr:acyl-CoA dehydrogenase family protein [Dactylosporangium sucinum]GGM45970.1 putative acyl-CoA dehydrogenase FadE [Dactylosporangium sucinum]